MNADSCYVVGGTVVPRGLTRVLRGLVRRGVRHFVVSDASLFCQAAVAQLLKWRRRGVTLELGGCAHDCRFVLCVDGLSSHW